MDISVVTKHVEIKYGLSSDTLTVRAGPLTVVRENVSGLVTDLVNNGTYDRFLYLCFAAGGAIVVGGLTVVAIKHLWPYMRVDAVYGGCLIIEIAVPSTYEKRFEELVKSGKMKDGLNEKLGNVNEFLDNLVSGDLLQLEKLENFSIDSVSLCHEEIQNTLSQRVKVLDLRNDVDRDWASEKVEVNNNSFKPHRWVNISFDKPKTSEEPESYLIVAISEDGLRRSLCIQADRTKAIFKYLKSDTTYRFAVFATFSDRRSYVSMSRIIKTSLRKDTTGLSSISSFSNISNSNISLPGMQISVHNPSFGSTGRSLAEDSKPRNMEFTQTSTETNDTSDVTIQWDLPCFDLDDYLIECFAVTITTSDKRIIAEEEKYFEEGSTTYYAGPYNLMATKSYVATVKTFYENVDENYKINTSNECSIEIPTDKKSKKSTKRKPGSRKRRSESPSKLSKRRMSEFEGMVCAGDGVYFWSDKRLASKSNVFEGRFTSSAQPEDIVVKVIRVSESLKEKNVGEVKILQEVTEHPNIVTYRKSGFFEFESSESIFIAMESCDKVNLYDKYSGRLGTGQVYTLDEKLHDLEGICKGLQHLHEKNILHRDLKPHNILFKGKVPKICDFGVSKELQTGKSKTVLSNKYIGTEGWKAPEMLDCLTISKSCDIFPTGLLFYFVLSGGKHAFGEVEYRRNTNIADGVGMCLEGLNGLPDCEVARSLISKMLNPDPKQRPTIEEVISDPFFWDVQKKFHFYEKVVKHCDHSKTVPEDESPRNYETPVLGSESWNNHDNLLLSSEEMGEIQLEHEEVLVEIIAKKASSNKYHPANIADLLQFILDCKLDLPVTEEWIWKFFSKRFSQLLPYVYSVLKEFYQERGPNDPYYLEDLANFFSHEQATQSGKLSRRSTRAF